jgi:hypothetical protein
VRRFTDKRRARGRSGQLGIVSIEMAISSVMFFAALLAVFDFGRMYFFHSRLTHAVSQATRFATAGNTLEDPLEPGTNLSRAESISLMIRELSGFSDLGDADIEIVHIGPSGVTLVGAGGPGDVVTVTANYRIGIIAPYLAPIFEAGVFELSAATAFRNEEIPAQRSLEFADRIIVGLPGGCSSADC